MKFSFGMAIVLLSLSSILYTACPIQSGSPARKIFIPDPPFPTISFPKQLIHRGVLAPDGQSYWFTLSDPQFEDFEAMVAYKEDGRWIDPEPASFNTKYAEHGMSFSPDGQWVYFSSTRPIKADDAPETWRIWRSQKENGAWKSPQVVYLPGLEQQLCSHPSISESGTLYFHSSNPDYSEMFLYSAREVNGAFQNAQRLSFAGDSMAQMCTPFVAPDESYLLFAVIGEQLDLHIAFRETSGNWAVPIPLNVPIETYGQGNPSVSPKGRFLFYTQGTEPTPGTPLDWKVSKVGFQELLQKAQANH